MASNQAAWLDGKASKLRVAEAPMPQLDPDGIIIKNAALAVNPVDWKIQDGGFFVKKWPMILGCDVAGEVVEVGENVKRFKKTDRVAAHMISLMTSNAEEGGFQLYSSAKADKAAIIPANVSFAEGSVLPLALDTAAVGLYGSTSEGLLGLPLPSHDPSSSGDVVFLWGGSSSVGALVIQLAVASGAKVVTTAGRHNFDLVKQWGASEVIDHKSPSVVEDAVAAVKNLGGNFVGTYEAISLPDSHRHALAITEKLGGGNYAYTLQAPESVPSNVKPGHIFGIDKLTHPIWNDYVTKALESGELKAVPEPLIVGKGLENVQKGLDENKAGVSARKVVIEL